MRSLRRELAERFAERWPKNSVDSTWMIPLQRLTNSEALLDRFIKLAPPAHPHYEELTKGKERLRLAHEGVRMMSLQFEKAIRIINSINGIYDKTWIHDKMKVAVTHNPKLTPK